MNKSLLPVDRPYGKYYAVQLKETKFKKTVAHEDTIEIIFSWEEIVENISQSKNDLAIQVAQANPESTKHEVKDLAKAIIETKNIQPLDRVFGVDNQSIEKIGYVSRKEITDETTVKLSVQWIHDSAFRDTEVPVFRDNYEIQALGSRDLNMIERHVGESIQKIYDSMPVIREEQHQYFKSAERLEYIEGLFPKHDQGGTITLFYGTNRNALQPSGEKQIYGSDVDYLKLGFCEVNIPRGHVQGELERPTRIIWEFPENQNRHVMVNNVRSMDRDTFIKEFNNTIDGAPEKNALLFVHGYRNSFEDAARRTAQLAWDLPFSGFSGFFSWPSSAKYSDYLSDEAKARSSFPALEEFLRRLLIETQLEHVHIIAHSMGTLVTTLSLNSLRRDSSIATQLDKIHQLILGASDIDQEEFRNTILPEFKNIGLRRTIYASDHDGALGVSSWGRRGRLRVGQVGDDIFLDEDIDTVEASNIESSNSHGYIFESKLLLTDLFYLITKNLNPAQRRLREVKKELLRYWLFLE